jgi:sulfur relay (sulfurtransferase) complex TusBCD TusD component (DsrE family)
VRIGSISQGKIKCDKCGRTVGYAERYLIVREKGNKEDDEKGEVRHYCVKCAEAKGYVETRQEKSETITTFFPKTEHLVEIAEAVTELPEERVVAKEEPAEESEETDA